VTARIIDICRAVTTAMPLGRPAN